jgi:ribosome maturation factor RimP
MTLATKIENEITPIVDDLGYGIVHVSIFGYEKKTLQIMIERKDDGAITIDDCERVGRMLSIRLDVMDPVAGSYNLEVSSPGMDRPLVKPKDFIKFCGRYVVVKAQSVKDGRKVFKGLLKNASEDGIKLSVELPDCDGLIELSYEDIESAHIDGSKS